MYIYIERKSISPGRSLLGYEGLFPSVSSGREMTMVVADKKNRKVTADKKYRFS